MFRVVCTTSLIYDVVPFEKGPMHKDKQKVMHLAAWLRSQGQDAIVQESPSGRCFDVGGKFLGTSSKASMKKGSGSVGA